MSDSYYMSLWQEWRKRALMAETQVRDAREVCNRTKGDTWDSYNQGYNDALGTVETALDGA